VAPRAWSRRRPPPLQQLRRGVRRLWHPSETLERRHPAANRETTAAASWHPAGKVCRSCLPHTENGRDGIEPRSTDKPHGGSDGPARAGRRRWLRRAGRVGVRHRYAIPAGKAMRPRGARRRLAMVPSTRRAGRRRGVTRPAGVARPAAERGSPSIRAAMSARLVAPSASASQISARRSTFTRCTPASATGCALQHEEIVGAGWSGRRAEISPRRRERAFGWPWRSRRALRGVRPGVRAGVAAASHRLGRVAEDGQELAGQRRRSRVRTRGSVFNCPSTPHRGAGSRFKHQLVTRRLLWRAGRRCASHRAPGLDGVRLHGKDRLD